MTWNYAYTPDIWPSAYKQRVTFTATVTGAVGTPTGKVTFYENTPGDAMSQALEKGDVKKVTAMAEAAGASGNVVTLVNGQAVFTTSSLPVGSHSMWRSTAATSTMTAASPTQSSRA